MPALDLHLPFGWNAFNPSIALHDGDYKMLVRVANYDLRPDMTYHVSDPDGMCSHLLMLDLSRDFSVTNAYTLDDSFSALPGRTKYRNDGYEDCRLYHDGDNWRAVGTTRAWNERGTCESVLLTFSDRYVLDPILLSHTYGVHEKNWMPVLPARLDIHNFLASCSPVTRVILNQNTIYRYDLPGPKRANRFRGGTQLLPFADGYLGLVHEIGLKMNGKRVYEHRWFWLSGDYTKQVWSDAFSFDGEEVEFAAGLAPVGDDFVVSYGVWDRLVALRTYSRLDIRDALEA